MAVRDLRGDTIKNPHTNAIYLFLFMVFNLNSPRGKFIMCIIEYIYFEFYEFYVHYVCVTLIR